MSEIDDDYEKHKERFKARNIISELHPYADHTELYLGLIEPEYCAEIQRTLVAKSLNEEKSPFAAANSQIKFHWQTTDDMGDTVDGEKVSNIFANKALYGTLEEHITALQTLNARGASVCVAVNKIEGSRRTKDNVVLARAIWLEDDKPVKNLRKPSSFPLPYSFAVETSGGKYHYYWLTETDDFANWQRIQNEVMVPLFGSDPGGNGLNRALRIPGFWHKKKNKFGTRIAFILDKNNIPLEPSPSNDFLDIAVPLGGKVEFAYNAEDCSEVIRYPWEDILANFGGLLTDTTSVLVNGSRGSSFDPIETMQSVINGEDYHASLHALCMHFANYQQDVEYVTNIVQSIMCRVPEAQRDTRWNSRFNDVKRSAKAAVNKKLEELTFETLHNINKEEVIQGEISLHHRDWVLPFPDTDGACIPLDLMLNDFQNIIKKPIKSFNFATIMSFFCACIQNIPIMPAMGERKANGCHLLLAQSTGGKDINMANPLRALARSLLQSGYVSSTDIRSAAILSSFTFMNSEITSLTAFHKWAIDPLREFGAVWSNTECTSIINKMSDENASVSNLAEVVINIQDGIAIPAVHRASKKDDNSTSYPLVEAYSLLFATQPASVQKHMNSRLLYKGVIGRFDYYIPAEPPQEDYESSLSVDSLRPYRYSQELLRFLGYVITVCSAHVVKTSKDPHDTHSREVVIKYDIDDPDPRSPLINSQMRKNGLNRQRHIDWDLKTSPKYRSDDTDFNIFINRVPMSTERYLTILTFMQHLWECYNNQVDPFGRDIVTSPALIDLACKLGDYQYKVRAERIWSLISRSKGLDDKHQAMLDAIKTADTVPERWMKHLTIHSMHSYKHLFETERFMPISGVTRCLTRDADISTKDAMHICKALADFGYIEFVALKKIDVRIADKALKNVVRLTAQGRT